VEAGFAPSSTISEGDQMSSLMIIAAVVAIAFLSWNLYRRFGRDHIQAFIDQRKAGSRFVSRGVFVDGNRQLDVALALDQNTLFYENRDMQASIDLQWVREVEYATALMTSAHTDGSEVMRLRSTSQTFEFLLPAESAQRWHLMLPQRSTAVIAAPPITKTEQSRADDDGWPVVPLPTAART
jgi:hypothetical protein